MTDIADAVCRALTGEMTAPAVAAAVTSAGNDCNTNMAHAALMSLLAGGKVARRYRGSPVVMRTVWSPVRDANECVDKGSEVAVEGTLSTAPITALNVAKRGFESPENHRARNVNPCPYALEKEGNAKKHPTRPPTWSVP